MCVQVHDALQDAPEQVEDFVSLLHEFEQVGDGQEVISLFSKLHSILGNRRDLLRDFAAFLHPEQALQCGLVRDHVVISQCYPSMPSLNDVLSNSSRSSRHLSAAADSCGSWRSVLEIILHIIRRSSRLCRVVQT